MMQPPTPISLGSASSPPKMESSRRRRPPPSPEETLAHYESQGMEAREASLKAIADLQAVLVRTLVSARGKKKNDPNGLRKLETRLAILEMKLDAKPGFAECFAIALTSGALVAAVPHALRALGQALGSLTRPPITPP